MARKRSAGVLATIVHKGRQKAILQIRDNIDSYPGCAQVTFHGELEKNKQDRFERVREGLRREFREEVYELFDRANAEPPAELFNQSDVPPNMEVISRMSNDKRQVVTLHCQINDATLIEQIQPLIATRVVRLVGSEDIGKLQAIDRDNPDHKNHGVEDGCIGMHQDELEVVQSVLTQQK